VLSAPPLLSALEVLSKPVPGGVTTSAAVPPAPGIALGGTDSEQPMLRKKIKIASIIEAGFGFIGWSFQAARSSTSGQNTA
jgi:hypothetical protein